MTAICEKISIHLWGEKKKIEGQNPNSIFMVHFISVNAHCGSWIFASLSAPRARLGYCFLRSESCLEFVKEKNVYIFRRAGLIIDETLPLTSRRKLKGREILRQRWFVLAIARNLVQLIHTGSGIWGVSEGQTGRKMKTKKVKGGWDRDIGEAVAEYSILLAEGQAGCWCSSKNWRSSASLSWNQHAVRLLLKLFKRKSTFSWAVNFW